MFDILVYPRTGAAMLEWKGECRRMAVPEALARSEEKWRYMAANMPSVPLRDGGHNTCGLCWSFPGCKGCPVAAVGGMHCNGTPYRNYAKYTMDAQAGRLKWDRDHAVQLATAEADFLAELRENADV